MRALRQFFASGPVQSVPARLDAEQRRRYSRARWSVFLSVTFGYGFFYVSRINFSVVKQPMLDAGVASTTAMGLAGSAMLVVYAVGKSVNGFLADRSNIRRFMSTGLLMAALLNLLIGSGQLMWAFVLLWGLNGWFQSMGSAPSVVALTHWFSVKERGVRYGVWSVSHSIGEGLTFALTATLVALWGWEAGFWLPGLLCLVVGLVLTRTLRDRPQAEGFPPVSVFTGEPEGEAKASVGRAQLEVLKQPAIWVLGLASASLYVVRYGLNNWGVLFLQQSKGYSLSEAGLVLSAYPVAALFGSVSAGFVSAYLAGGRHGRPAMALALLQLLSLFLLGNVSHELLWLDLLTMVLFGLSMGGLLVYLGGLMAIDMVGKEAAGAAMGIIGLFSYVGAAIQDLVTGVVLDAGSSKVDGGVVLDFGPITAIWLSASTASALFLALVMLLGRRAAEQKGEQGDDSGLS
ncbi:MAG: MFS transporter [Myxococcota bacterium]|jgi:OPA family sugar phosphate sensor protein UhpC-like MFS transporter|nr:MFS transporter [Myxococcota bacterium]